MKRCTYYLLTGLIMLLGRSPAVSQDQGPKVEDGSVQASVVSDVSDPVIVPKRSFRGLPHSSFLDNKLNDLGTSSKEHTFSQITKYIRIKGVFLSIALLFLASFLLRLVHRLVEEINQRFTQRRLLLQKLETFIQFFIYMATASSCFLLSFQVTKELLTIIGGTAAVSFGFAVKDLVASLIAGLMIMVDRPFQVGDRVRFGTEYGDIVAIGLRSVRMQTLTDDMVTIPNNNFLKEVTVCGNYGKLSMQTCMDFYIGLDQDAEQACRIVSEAAASSRYIYLPNPILVLVKQVVQENYITARIRLKAYVLDTHYEEPFETDVNLRVMKEFEKQGIKPPAILHRNS